MATKMTSVVTRIKNGTSDVPETKETPAYTQVVRKVLIKCATTLKENSQGSASWSKTRKRNDGRNRSKYSRMIKDAVMSLKERHGSFRQAILKFVLASFSEQTNKRRVNNRLKTALRAGVKYGKPLQSRGQGAKGSYKIGNIVAVRKASEPSKPVSHKGTQITKVKEPEAAAKRIMSLVSTSGHTKPRRQKSIKATKASKCSKSHAQRLHGLQKCVKNVKRASKKSSRSQKQRNTARKAKPSLKSFQKLQSMKQQQLPKKETLLSVVPETEQLGQQQQQQVATETQQQGVTAGTCTSVISVSQNSQSKKPVKQCRRWK